MKNILDLVTRIGGQGREEFGGKKIQFPIDLHFYFVHCFQENIGRGENGNDVIDNLIKLLGNINGNKLSWECHTRNIS